MLLILWPAGRLSAEWPEQALTLVSSIPESLPWSEEPTPQARILRALVPRLSRELGVPVALSGQAEGQGVLAANRVALARPDGYLLGALSADSAISLVIQGYTPYTWNEIAPVATAWRPVMALVGRADLQADDLQGLAALAKKGRLRLAHQGLEPVGSAALLALEAVRAAGFQLLSVQVELNDPALLLEGRADLMVLPLGWLPLHPRASELKVLAVLTADDRAPCLAGRQAPAARDLKFNEHPVFAFYLPAKVNRRTRSRLSTALGNALRQPALAAQLREGCLIPHREDLEGVEAVMNQEYRAQEAELSRLTAEAEVR
jgi:tripartite-type tricarboxylate transporter receptor subunit TctC